MLDHDGNAPGPGTRGSAGVPRPLTVLALGSALFTVLLVLVALEWAPLRSLDRSVSLELNEVVGASGPAAAVLRTLTDLGDPVVTAGVLAVLTIVLLVRRLPRLAGWVAVTGLGLAVLDPLVKGLVGRARPSLPIEVATAPGQSFPSGHALASFALFTILLLVALPAVPRGRRRWAVAAVVAAVVAVGFTRVALGVHYVSDVLAGWGLSAAWVATTALVFRARMVPDEEGARPLREGLEPDAAPALRPAPEAQGALGPHPGRTVALLGAGLVAVTALVAGLGFVVTEVLRGTWVGEFDRAAVQALTTLGVPGLDGPAAVVNALGGTRFVTSVALSAAVLAVAATRRWRPALFLLTALLGEVAVYILVSRVVIDRARPDAGAESQALPDLASFPSGHAAAAMTLYGAIALIVHAHVHGRWRTVALIVPMVLGLLVAVGRLYRGVHYPTDVLGSALLTVTWLAITYPLLMRRRAGRRTRLWTSRRSAGTSLSSGLSPGPSAPPAAAQPQSGSPKGRRG